MDFLTTLLISIGLAMDCFAVSLCAATINVKQNFRYRFRISFHFGLFQGGFTLIGYLLGSTVASLIQSIDHWIAFALLAFVATKMIKEGLETNEDFCPSDPSRGKMLVLFSIATSIDALAVGLSLGIINSEIISTSLLIGLTSIVFSLLGLFLGRKLSTLFGKKMEILGGLVLLFIALRILIEHHAFSATAAAFSHLF